MIAENDNRPSRRAKLLAAPLPRPSTIDIIDEVGDLIRDPTSHVIISAGGRDQGPMIKRGPNGGKRQVHGDLSSDEIQYEQDKHQHRVNRKIDGLRDMFNRGSLSRDEKIAAALFADGLRFQDTFDKSHWGSSGGMRFDNMPASGKVSTEGGRTDTIVSARREIMDAIDFLGGSATIGAIAMWQIVGLRKTFREMARDNGDHLSMWKGAMISALGSLGAYYDRLGYDRRKTTKR